MIPRPPSRKYEGFYPVVRDNSREYPISEHDLEMGLRTGRIPLDVLIYFSPWTGEEFLPVWQVKELRESCRAPYALLIDHLRQSVVPWASLALFLTGLVVGVLQFRGWLGNDIIAFAAMGWGSTLLNGQWWTPWLSQLIHLDLFHFFGNVSVLFYCAFRVERAFGFWAVLVSASLGLLMGTLLVLLFGDRLVVGSSTIVFGVWACQVAIGFRLADVLPREFRGLYGWGNFLLFAPLLLINIMSNEVSHLAHLGGILGGTLVGFLYTPDSMKRRLERNAAKSFGEVVSIHVVLLALLVVGSSPKIASFPEQVREQKSAGVYVSLPSRMTKETWNSMNIWRTAHQGNDFFFADSFWLSDFDRVSTEDLRTWWSNALDRDVVVEEQNADASGGWRDFFIQDEGRIIWERVQQDGKYLIRTGCTFENPDSNLVPFCRRWLDSVELREPLELQQARERYRQFSQRPDEAFGYATLLSEFGRPDEADLIYKQLSFRSDLIRWRAMYERMLLRLSDPQFSTWQQDAQWVEELFLQIPISQGRLFEVAVQYSNVHQQCEVVSRAWKRWSGLISVQDEAMYNLVNQCRP